MLKQVRNKLNKIPLISFIASTKLAVVLIFLLIIIVIAGTLEQSESGLFLAREKYFNSYLCFFGAMPFPGTLTILWLMTINLSLSFLLRFNFTKKNTGLVLSHSGLILLFVSGFFHFYYSKESFIDLQEAETSSISKSYDNWQLEVKSYDENFKLIQKESLDINNPEKKSISLDSGLKIILEKKYTNAKVFHTPFAGTIVKEFPLEKEYEKNIPALKLLVNNKEIFLDGSLNDFEKLFIDKLNVSLNLKREEFQLPFSIELLDVKRELHPNSAVAKSYSSKVIFRDSKLEREALISMNKPIRSGQYTVYQARYGIDEDGNESSVLAVVKNLNYQLPYWATFLINFGLLLHFVLAFLNYRRKKQ